MVKPVEITIVTRSKLKSEETTEETKQEDEVGETTRGNEVEVKDEVEKGDGEEDTGKSQ